LFAESLDASTSLVGPHHRWWFWNIILHDDLFGLAFLPLVTGAAAA
jgi:hypothetical protein